MKGCDFVFAGDRKCLMEMIKIVIMMIRHMIDGTVKDNEKSPRDQQVSDMIAT